MSSIGEDNAGTDIHDGFQKLVFFATNRSCSNKSLPLACFMKQFSHIMWSGHHFTFAYIVPIRCKIWQEKVKVPLYWAWDLKSDRKRNENAGIFQIASMCVEDFGRLEACFLIKRHPEMKTGVPLSREESLAQWKVVDCNIGLQSGRNYWSEYLYGACLFIYIFIRIGTRLNNQKPIISSVWQMTPMKCATMSPLLGFSGGR